MTTTPYELRFNMLQFAHSMLESEHHQEWRKIEMIKQMAESSEQNAAITFPQKPSPEKVFELAERINAFVSVGTSPKT